MQTTFWERKRRLGLGAIIGLGALGIAWIGRPLQVRALSDRPQHFSTLSVDGRRIEPTYESKTLVLSYNGRALEVETKLFAQIRLEEPSPRTGKQGKRILAEELGVLLDLSEAQWKRVFPQWFYKRAGLSRMRAGRATEVVLGGRRAWQYTFVRAAAGSPVRYWKVYLLPRGRFAIVLRSAGWGQKDASLYNPLLADVAASVD